jgi:hypothetical protein
MTSDSRAGLRETERSRAGIIDRLLDGIEQLPIPYLVFCLIVFVIGVVLLPLAMVLRTPALSWSIDLDSILSSYVMAYSLGLMLYVRRSARQSLAAFAPVLDLDDAAYQRLQTNLIRTPTVPALLTGVSVVATSLLANYLLVSEGIRLALSTPVGLITMLVLVCLTYGVVGILIYDLIRKLWLISRIYTLGGKFDLFNRRTLYAFSGLTARILAGWLILSYPNALLAAGNWRSPAWLTVTGLTLAVILIAFAYTLLHIHQRIRAEKERLLLEVRSRLHQSFTRLHERMDRDTLQDVAQLKVLMDSLVVERDVLTKISTWPWQGETLASFSSVVLLPIGLWLIQTVIKQLLGTG